MNISRNKKKKDLEIEKWIQARFCGGRASELPVYMIINKISAALY